MRQTVKLAGYRAARASGYFSAVSHSPWRRRRLVILCYHGISLADEHQWMPALYLTADIFRQRLATLRRRGCNILPLDEAVARLREGTLPERSVALTFDDGFFDFYRHAAPALREYNAPATVYVTSYYAHDQRAVFDPMLDYLLWRGTGQRLEWPEVLPAPVVLSEATRPAVWQKVSAFVSALKYTAEAKDDLLRNLSGHIGLDYKNLSRQRMLHLMNADELNSIRQEGFDLQLHTHRHRVPRQRDQFIREINDNRASLGLVGRPAAELRHFCYPSGVYYPECGGWLRDCGVVSATTCDPAIASAATDPFYLPRFSDQMNIPGIVFEAWVTGAASLLPHRPKPGGHA